MIKQRFKVTVIAASLMMLCGMLSPARGQTPTGACQDRILQGDYAFTVEGLVFPAPGVEVAIRGVHLTTFDGDGHFTQVDHLIVGGQPPALEWTPASGTYHINPDCTGTMRINVPSSGTFVNLRFVVSGRGRQIYTVVTAPYDGPVRTVTSTGIRRDY